MDITINISDEKFESVCRDEIEAIPKEQLREAMLDAIKEYMTKNTETFNNNNFMFKLLFTDNSNRYMNSGLEPSEFTKQLFANCDCSAVQEVADKMIDYLKTNHRAVLEDIILRLLIDTLTDPSIGNNLLRSNLHSIFTEMYYRQRNYEKEMNMN